MRQYRSRLLSSSAYLLLTCAVILPAQVFSAQPETEEDETKVVANDSDSVQLENLIPGGDPTGDPVFDYLGGGNYDSLSEGVEESSEGETVVTVGSDSPGGSDATDLYQNLLTSGSFSSNTAGENSSAYGSGFWLDASKAREELRRLGIQKLTVLNASHAGKKKGRALTQEELGVIAASRSLQDDNIETIYIAFDRLNVDYRSLGRLFGVIPMTFTLKISIYPESLIESERVKLKFPWYKFFLRTYVSASELRKDINTVIETTRLQVSRVDYPADAQAALLVSVSELLKARSDAVSVN